jgi:hypothetical protein
MYEENLYFQNKDILLMIICGKLYVTSRDIGFSDFVHRPDFS